jgi:hypothetical protein
MVKPFLFLAIYVGNSFNFKIMQFNNTFISIFLLILFIILGLYFVFVIFYIEEKENKKFKVYSITNLFVLIKLYKQTNNNKFLLLFILSIFLLLCFIFLGLYLVFKF